MRLLPLATLCGALATGLALALATACGDGPPTPAPASAARSAATRPAPSASAAAPVTSGELAPAPRREIAGPKTATFRFAPRGGARYRVLSDRTKTKTDPAGRAVGKEQIHTEQIVTITRADDGYLIAFAPDRFSHQGNRGAAAFEELMAGFPVTLSLSASGQVSAATGYDDVQDRARKMLGAAELAAAGPVLVPETLRQARVAEWRGRVGDLVGQTFTLGEPMVGSSDTALGAATLRMHSVVVAGPWLTCPLGTCIEVTQTYDTDRDALSGSTGVRLPPPDGARGPTPAAVAAGPRMHGVSRRVLDPATMLLASETTARTIVLGAGTLTDELVVRYAYPSPGPTPP